MAEQSFTDTKKLLIFVSVFLVVFLAFFFAFWRPRYVHLRKYQKELKIKDTELVQLERDAKDWPETITREKLRQYEVELERLWDLIPSREEVAMLLDEIETHAKASNLEIRSLIRVSDTKRPVRKSSSSESSSAEEEPEYIKVPYKIALGGNYPGLVRFLRKLEDSKRLVTITGIKMNKGQGAHPIDSEIQFNIYYSRVGVGQS